MLLLDKKFPKSKKLHQITNWNKFKVSNSWLAPKKWAINNYIKEML